MGCSILFIPIVIIFFIVIDQLVGGPENRLKQRKQDLISVINRIENVLPRYYNYGNLRPTPLFEDAFNLFGKDLYTENKILMRRLLRAMIRSNFKRDIGFIRCKVNNPGKRWSDWIINERMNKNKTLRDQLLADREYWERVAVQLCNQEYDRKGGW